jgi:ornithine cyclodeaminase/alanine dehydrogenase
MNTLILSAQEVERSLTVEASIEAVERAFAAHGRGEVVMPPKLYLPLPKHHGDFRAMPAAMEGWAGVKWVNMHPENPARHKLPAVQAVYILSDPETGHPLAVMDGTRLTAYRTGAAAAIASKHLGPKNPSTIGFLGCGVQARAMLKAHRVLFTGLRVVAYDAVPEAAEKFAAETGGHTAAVDQAGSCDLVCVATPSRAPVLHRAYVGISTHINAMGADAPGKQEVDPQLLRDAVVVVDDLAQACESGEINVPLHQGKYGISAVHGTLGEVVAGKKPGRRGTEITLFDSTGLAIQDLALASAVFERARREGVGLALSLVGA